MTNRPIAFLATGRSGLGHLRRAAAIARAVRAASGAARPILLCNAEPDGLTDADRAAFQAILVVPRSAMAAALRDCGAAAAVLDTLRLPDAATLDLPMIQVLRETPAASIEGFRRGGGRPWDAVIVPNPPGHWMPPAGPGFARTVEAVGWIARRAGVRGPGAQPGGVVLATGGGGTEQSRAALYPLLDRVIALARAQLDGALYVRQALGPRAAGAALGEADEVFDPGPDLDAVFRAADLAISTAGYNSVLELASTDTPALLAAIPRSLDDQAARARLWGPRLGHALDPAQVHAAADWLVGQVARPRRRAPVDLGPDGAARAAALILGQILGRA